MATSSLRTTRQRRPHKHEVNLTFSMVPHSVSERSLTYPSVWYPPPLADLRALQASGASHREIVRRLRLNLAIRMLIEAEAAADRAGAL